MNNVTTNSSNFFFKYIKMHYLTHLKCQIKLNELNNEKLPTLYFC